MTTQVQIVVSDLFLPPGLAAEACAGLPTPALGKILARAQREQLPAASLEGWLCAAFGVEDQGLAPVTLRADGGHPGTAYWLRADPVHLILRHGELILRPITTLDSDEAAALCDSLNRHFAVERLHFIAPRPQHWYLHLDAAPDLSTHPLVEVADKDIHGYLPQGADALKWHRLLNEIQMLLFSHPVNQEREARGDWSINSVWLWGGGRVQELMRPCDSVYTDNAVAAALAEAAGVKLAPLPGDGARCLGMGEGETLIVWDGLSIALQRGDIGEWRESLERFEQRYATPLLRALRGGRVEKIMLDVLQAHGSWRFTLTRGMTWRIWRMPKRIEALAG